MKARSWGLAGDITTVSPSPSTTPTAPHTAIPLHTGLFIALIGFLASHINRYVMWYLKVKNSVKFFKISKIKRDLLCYY